MNLQKTSKLESLATEIMETEALRGKGLKNNEENFSDWWDNSSNLTCV